MSRISHRLHELAAIVDDAIELNEIALRPDGTRPKMKRPRVRGRIVGLSPMGKAAAIGIGAVPFAVMAHKMKKSEGKGNAEYADHYAKTLKRKNFIRTKDQRREDKDAQKKALKGTYATRGAVAGYAGGGLIGGGVAGLPGAIYGANTGMVAGAAMGQRIDRKPKKDRVARLEAMLDDAINFEKLDLGYTNKEVYGDDSGLCGPYDHKAEANKKRFPTFHVNRLKGDPFKFPDEGEATIKFKVTSRETRNNNGKENNSLSLEIQSIDPVEKKAKEKNLEAFVPGMIEFATPGQVARAVRQTKNVIKADKVPGAFKVLSPEADRIAWKKKYPGTAGPDTAKTYYKESSSYARGGGYGERESKQVEKAIGNRRDISKGEYGEIRRAVKRKVADDDFRAYTKPARVKTLKKLGGSTHVRKKGSDKWETLSALLDTIDLTDPRPRNQQGMFADTTEAGADPNTMGKAYGRRSGISPDMLKKLRRKLPRFAVGGM